MANPFAPQSEWSNWMTGIGAAPSSTNVSPYGAPIVPTKSVGFSTTPVPEAFTTYAPPPVTTPAPSASTTPQTGGPTYGLPEFQTWATGQFGRAANDAEIQQIIAQLPGYVSGQPLTAAQFEQAKTIAQTLAASKGWNNPAPGTTPGTTPPVTTPKPDYLATPGNVSDFFATFAPPEYKAPDPFSYAAFKPPTMEEAQNEPGYQFGLTQGEGAIKNDRAFRGTFRTGGTLKDILKFGQDYATQNYDKVNTRAANTYAANYGLARDAWDTNRQVGLDTWNSKYKGAQDAFNATFRGQELTFADLLARWRQQVESQTALATMPD